MKKNIITISRQFGSGGRFIGGEVAKQLGISYYDKNIIVMNDKPHHIETPNSIHIWPVPDEVAEDVHIDEDEEQ